MEEAKKLVVKRESKPVNINSEHEGTFENYEDKMAGKCEITIPVFDGEDYGMWKKRMTLYLKFKKYHEVVEREKVATDRDDWDEKDLKAMNHIYSAISNKQLEKLRLNNHSDSSAFFSNFEKSVNELKAAGAKISEKE